ncbi:citrate lyase holo-[acyl-carrier protein] synthase [Mycoplasmatota bacterium WC44]
MILDDRENRFYLQKELVEKYKLPLVVFRINYPGNKNNYIVSTIYKLIKLDLKYVYQKELNESEGMVLLAIVDENAMELKQRMIEIEENHPLGRLLDIDVYDEFYNQLSRTDYGYSDRLCLMCDDFAKYCIRGRKHTLKDVQDKIFKMFVDYFSIYVSELIEESMLAELNLLDKPGLVTPISNGAHDDMDYNLMVKSIRSLKSGFEQLTKKAFTSDFKTCRQIGIEMEEEMFLATNNINTHKGGIFLFGTLVLGVVNSLKTSIDLKDMIKIIMSGVSKELNNDAYSSHGKDVYLKYGLLGIRGQAEKGFPLIFDNLDGDLHKVLFEIMSKCDDTNILYRHDINTLNKVKSDAARILIKLNISDIKKLDEEYINKNISPGGAADLLGGVIFVNRIKEII